MTDLIDCIALIKAELKNLPPVDYSNADGRSRRDQAIADLVRTLAEKLPKVRINDRWDGTSVSIAGVRATCTGGIEGALTNWIAAAHRRLDQTGWIQSTGEKENVR